MDFEKYARNFGQIETSRMRSDPPLDRYHREASFKALVDMIEAMIYRCDFTPTEVREAAMLAAIRYEQRVVRDFNGDVVMRSENPSKKGD